MIGNFTVDDKELSPDGSCWDLIHKERTRQYIRVSAEEPVASHYIKGIGELELRINVGEGNDRRALALVRHPGLMLTDAAKNLGQANPSIPTHWKNFTAVLYCAPREGDLVLKNCEPPSHDGLSVDEIPQTDKEGRRQARQALKKLKEWLRKEIAKHASRDSEEGSSAHELDRYGLLIDDVQRGARVKIEPLRILNRAPRAEQLTPKAIQEDEVEEDDDDSETEQPTPYGGEGSGGNRRGSRTTEGSISVSRKPRVDLSPIFRSIAGETHKLIASIAPSEFFSNEQDLRFSLRAIGEDEQGQTVGLMSASLSGKKLESVEKNVFVIPKEYVKENIRDERIEIELVMNEPVGVSSFTLAYLVNQT